MSSTNTTEFYGLTQYIGTDKPSFTDNNEAFRAVDAALHGAVTDVADASDNITTLTGRVGDVEDAVTGLSGTVGTQGDAITALQNKEISQDGDIAGVKAAALDMICAFNEEAAQSVHAYAIGDFFRYNDVLYKASAVINIGDTIIPNTNCVATNVTEQLLNDVDKVGNLSSLTTTDKSSAVAAINEVEAGLTDVKSGLLKLDNSTLPTLVDTITVDGDYYEVLTDGYYKISITSGNITPAASTASVGLTQTSTIEGNLVQCSNEIPFNGATTIHYLKAGTKLYAHLPITNNAAYIYKY